MSGNIKKYQKSKGYESLSRSMLQDTENLSLQAIGLLAYLTSLPDDWKVRKTELYTRFKLNGKKSVASAWNNLVEAGYILQFKIRNGKRFDYKYYHFHEPFTKEDIRSIEKSEGYTVWDGTKENSSIPVDISSNAQKVHSKVDSSNAPFELPILDFPKGAYIKLTNKQVTHKDKDLDTNDTPVHEQDFEVVTDSEKKKRKQEYMQKGFLENEDVVPRRIAIMLDAFSKDEKQAREYYRKIILAKKKVEDEFLVDIRFENDPELEGSIINAFSRAILKIEKERNIENPGAYIYQTIYKTIHQEISARARRRETSDVYFDWTSEQGVL